MASSAKTKKAATVSSAGPDSLQFQELDIVRKQAVVTLVGQLLAGGKIQPRGGRLSSSELELIAGCEELVERIFSRSQRVARTNAFQLFRPGDVMGSEKISKILKEREWPHSSKTWVQGLISEIKERFEVDDSTASKFFPPQANFNESHGYYPGEKKRLVALQRFHNNPKFDVHEIFKICSYQGILESKLTAHVPAHPDISGVDDDLDETEALRGPFISDIEEANRTIRELRRLNQGYTKRSGFSPEALELQAKLIRQDQEETRLESEAKVKRPRSGLQQIHDDFKAMDRREKKHKGRSV